MAKRDYTVPEDEKRVNISFTYNSPKSELYQPERYQELRELARNLALVILENVPPGREKSLAITKLEESIMWANKGIACNE